MKLNLSLKNYHNILINLSLTTLSLVLVFVAGEIYLRALRIRVITFDQELGWKATPNYTFSGVKESFDGSQYSVYVSQDGQGFRMFGDLANDKLKLFVVGDSVTQAIDASDDKTYYAVIRQLLDVEVFAYGLSGAGV